MSKTYKDSPQPLNKEVESSPIFTMEDGPYVVKAMTPMQRQRYEDGTLHSMDRLTAIGPRGLELYLSGDKVIKSTPQGDEPIDVAAVVKSFMEADDESDDLKKKK